MAALRRIPEPKGDDPDANRRFVRSRIKIADEMYKEGRAALNDGQAAFKAAADLKGPEHDAKLMEAKNKIAEGTKQYREMDTLVGTLLERVGKLEFVAGEVMEGVPEAKRKEAEAKRKEQEDALRGELPQPVGVVSAVRRLRPGGRGDDGGQIMPPPPRASIPLWIASRRTHCRRCVTIQHWPWGS